MEVAFTYFHTKSTSHISFTTACCTGNKKILMLCINLLDMKRIEKIRSILYPENEMQE